MKAWLLSERQCGVRTQRGHRHQTNKDLASLLLLLICGLKVLLLIEEPIHHFYHCYDWISYCRKDNQPKKKLILSKIEWCLGHRPRTEGLVVSEYQTVKINVIVAVCHCWCL